MVLTLLKNSARASWWLTIGMLCLLILAQYMGNLFAIGFQPWLAVVFTGVASGVVASPFTLKRETALAWGLPSKVRWQNNIVVFAVLAAVLVLGQLHYMSWPQLAAMVFISACIMWITTESRRNTGTAVHRHSRGVKTQSLHNRKPVLMVVVAAASLAFAVLMHVLIPGSFGEHFGWLLVMFAPAYATAPAFGGVSLSSWLAFGRTRSSWRRRTVGNAVIAMIIAALPAWILSGHWAYAFLCAGIAALLVGLLSSLSQLWLAVATGGMAPMGSAIRDIVFHAEPSLSIYIVGGIVWALGLSLLIYAPIRARSLPAPAKA